MKLWQPSTGDPAALRQSLERIQQSGYATYLYDGLFSACFNQFPQADSEDVAQRVIVLFSDGEDTGSLHGMSDVVALAQRYEIQILLSRSIPGACPRRGMRCYSDWRTKLEDGFISPPPAKIFPAIFAEMQQQMRTQYVVSFQPQQDTPGFHSLRLELSGPQKMRVHARRGYYFETP